jgi:uncharacterized protein (TIGR03437 family)
VITGNFCNLASLGKRLTQQVRISKLAAIFLLLAWLTAGTLFAQAPPYDNSGNGLLNGTYYFREVIYVLSDASGNFGRAISIYGNITFDGNGAYNITGTSVFDSDVGAPQTYTVAGTYTIASNGFGYLSSPIATSAVVYGLVSNGVFVGSSTENGFNDLFIAAKLASPTPTAASFRGSYRAFMADVTADRDALLTLNPDGAGNLGTVNMTGYIATSTVVNQTASSVKYLFSNGAANVQFPGTQLSNSQLLVGNHYLYFSADGNFFFGGSPTGWDMIVGVRNPTDAPTFAGLYYQAGVDENDANLASATPSSSLDTFYGALSAAGGVTLEHQRLLSPVSSFSNNGFDLTFADTYSVASDGTYTASGYKYIVGPGGAVRVGLGIGPLLAINVAVKAPSLSGDGVFLNPVGVLNAASSSPFTTGISRGELISLYGTNLAANTVVASGPPFPTQLGNVQVMINGRPAPIYFVSSGQVSVIVPYATEQTVAGIQVINNGVPSNTVTTFVGLTTPGIFTKPAGGLGPGAVLHADFTLVTMNSPALPGETVQIYLTGLGDVTPAISDGDPGPVSPLSKTSNTIQAFIGGMTATVGYAGLAPQLAGLYQLNVTIPTGVAAGTYTLDVSGPDSYNTQAAIVIGPTPTAVPESIAPSPKARATAPRAVKSSTTRPRRIN